VSLTSSSESSKLDVWDKLTYFLQMEVTFLGQAILAEMKVTWDSQWRQAKELFHQNCDEKKR